MTSFSNPPPQTSHLFQSTHTPAPQVLTYYTMWNLYRNTNGALGTTRMTKFITQNGTSANIRVNYAAEARWVMAGVCVCVWQGRGGGAGGAVCVLCACLLVCGSHTQCCLSFFVHLLPRPHTSHPTHALSGLHTCTHTTPSPPSPLQPTITRLDKYHDAANDCPEGVLSEDDIEALVNDLREPDLLDALLSLRSKALRDAGNRTSKGGDEYTALPPGDPGSSPTGFGAASRKTSSAW